MKNKRNETKHLQELNALTLNQIVTVNLLPHIDIITKSDKLDLEYMRLRGDLAEEVRGLIIKSLEKEIRFRRKEIEKIMKSSKL